MTVYLCGISANNASSETVVWVKRYLSRVLLLINRSGFEQFVTQMLQLLAVLARAVSYLLLKIEKADQLLWGHVDVIA